ncbi:MAG: 5-(carboxyamino)imidazole ribonucleotide synthase [Pyrobaculum sp.]
MRLLTLGGGQLALMLCWAARRLSVMFRFVDTQTAPASHCAEAAGDPYTEVERSDVITFEFENVDLEVATYAHKLGKLRPHLEYLKIKKSRIWERELLNSLRVPTMSWRMAEGGLEALKIAERWGKALVKIPSGGYDGKGQYVYPRETGEIEKLAGTLLVEEYVDVKREFSIVAARGEDGEAYFYPPTQNYYVDGILVWSLAPTSVPVEAYEYVYKILEWRKYVGVIAVEFFESRDGRLLVNEIAPRVHNTGHWTLETDASQFENHVRAVMGLPIKMPRAIKPTAMVNILGKPLDGLPLRELERLGKVYWYRKAEARPRRKMGHLNIVGERLEETAERARRALQLIYGREFPQLVMRPRPMPQL